MRQVPGFGIEVVPARERVVLVLTGELDLDTAAQLQTALDEVRGNGFDQIVVDLRAVTFLDSTGVELLMREEQKGGGFSIAYRDGPVKRILEITGLLGHFDTRPVAVDAARHAEAATRTWLHGLNRDSATA
jgi:anti-anti-sigma factor